jgi:hypothetical protein
VLDVQDAKMESPVYIQSDGSRVVASRLLKQLSYESHGLAGIRVADGWMYVNRHGEAVTGVPTFDNGPDEFRDGLVRFVKNKKYGFANRSGKVVIPPIYDGALPFQDGRADVCSGCVDKCVDHECEHRMFSGGEWLSINQKGAILK